MREPQINERWQDAYGNSVTITHLAFNRVRFIRDGYKFPVTVPVERFVKEFTFQSRGAQQ